MARSTASQASLHRQIALSAAVALVRRLDFICRLADKVASARRDKTTVAVLVGALRDGESVPSCERAVQAALCAVEASLGPDDECCRIGADEFAVLLSGSAAVDAVGERIRATLDRSGLIEVDVGGAVCMPGDTVEALLGRAYEALQRKRSERVVRKPARTITWA